MSSSNANIDFSILRNYSSAFSRSAFTDVLNYDDFTNFDRILHNCKTFERSTYFELITFLYSNISQNYRCEYVYKNELIKHLLKYGTKNTVFFNEFRAGNSIADLAVFNGESKAFEIKTEYDTPRRLDKQLEDYKSFFDRCYLVIAEKKLEEYMSISDKSTGIICMSKRNGRIRMEEIRSATQNNHFDASSMMSCLRTEEYKNITTSLGFITDNIPGYELYSYCKNIIINADPKLVRTYFIREIKKRKNNTALLRRFPMPLRQIMLSLNLSDIKAEKLIILLNKKINQI